MPEIWTIRLITLAFLLQGCSESKKEVLKIGFVDWIGYYPFVLAKDSGFFNESVTMHEVSNASESLSLFRNGLSDGIGYQSSAVGVLMLEMVLKVSNLKLEDILPAYISYHEHIQAYENGEVDKNYISLFYQENGSCTNIELIEDYCLGKLSVKNISDGIVFKMLLLFKV